MLAEPIEPRAISGQEQEVDTRPIWPGRPEVIYTNYLATKEAWLATYPIVEPSDYYREAGLKVWGRRYYEEQRAYMPMDRLDLSTGTVIRQRLNRWSNKEVEAYLDYQDQLDQEAEAEEQLQGFGGRNKEHIIAEGRAKARKEARIYRFVDGCDNVDRNRANELASLV